MFTGIGKITNLIKKTGDKAIIVDANGEPTYVIMTVFDYERLVLGHSEVRGLTEEELLDKINRDIAIWKGSQELENLPIDQYDFSKNFDFGSQYGKFSQDKPNYGYEPEVVDDEESERFYFETVE